MVQDFVHPQYSPLCAGLAAQHKMDKGLVSGGLLILFFGKDHGFQRGRGITRKGGIITPSIFGKGSQNYKEQLCCGPTKAMMSDPNRPRVGISRCLWDPLFPPHISGQQPPLFFAVSLAQHGNALLFLCAGRPLFSFFSPEPLFRTKRGASGSKRSSAFGPRLWPSAP